MKVFFIILILCIVASAAAIGEDLTTLTGLTFNNIQVKEVSQDSILIWHETGISRVYFSEIPGNIRDHYTRMASHPAPGKGTLAQSAQGTIGSNDIVTLGGIIYRNAQVISIEPDGISIKDSAGIIKLFVSELSQDTLAKYGLSAGSALKYQQRKIAAQQEREAQMNQNLEKRNSEWAQQDMNSEQQRKTRDINERNSIIVTVKIMRIFDGGCYAVSIVGSYGYHIIGDAGHRRIGDIWTVKIAPTANGYVVLDKI